jgi:hypothetical protein
MNNSSEVYGLQYIGHVKSWVGDGIYDSRPHFAIRPLQSVRDLEASSLVENTTNSNRLVTTSLTSIVTSTSSSSTTTSTGAGSAALAAAVALKESMERIMPGGTETPKSSFLNTLQTQLHSPISAQGHSISMTATASDFAHNPSETNNEAIKHKQNTQTEPPGARSVNTENTPTIARGGSSSAPQSSPSTRQTKKVFSQHDTHNRSNGNLHAPPLVVKTTSSSSSSFVHSVIPGDMASPNQKRFMEHLSARKDGANTPVDSSRPVAPVATKLSQQPQTVPGISIQLPVRASLDPTSTDDTTHQLVEKEEQYLVLRKDRSVSILHSKYDHIVTLFVFIPFTERHAHSGQ